MKINGIGKSDERMREVSMGKLKSPLGALRQLLFAAVLMVGIMIGNTVAEAAPGDISGTVYNDVDNNLTTKPGLGDYGVSGVVVGLYDSTGTTEIKNAGTHITATTSSSGTYLTL